MTYLIPTIYKFILFIFCVGLFFHTLSRLGEIEDSLENLSRADLELLACAQRKANLRNFELAFYYLSPQFPLFVEDFRSTRERLKEILFHHEMECTHPLFKTFHASTRDQDNTMLPEYWPNTIYAIQERKI